MTAPAVTVLTAAEKAEGWQLVFDGSSFAGWRGYRLPGPPPAGWEIRDGLLGTVANVRGVELLTEKPFTDFELSWEWRFVVRGTRVEHWLNGRNVLTYETSSAAVKAGVAASKFRNEPGFGDKATGHLMLTYHNDTCWYRNLKVRELK